MRLQRYSAQKQASRDLREASHDLREESHELREASHDLPQKQTTTEHNQDGELSTQDDDIVHKVNDFCSPQGLAILQYRLSAFYSNLFSSEVPKE